MNAICPDFLETPKMSTIADANITDEIVFPSIKYVSLPVRLYIYLFVSGCNSIATGGCCVFDLVRHIIF